MQMYKCLLISLHPPNIYMLELSLTSMQCTHVLPLSCFVGKGHWQPSHPIVGGKVGEWQEPYELRWQRPWAR